VKLRYGAPRAPTRHLLQLQYVVHQKERSGQSCRSGPLATSRHTHQCPDESSRVARHLPHVGVVEQERRFTADVSHELHMPLATPGTELDWALGRDRSAPEYRNSLEVCQRAVGRMQKPSNKKDVTGRPLMAVERSRTGRLGCPRRARSAECAIPCPSPSPRFARLQRTA
jgi:hypothetical protein